MSAVSGWLVLLGTLFFSSTYAFAAETVVYFHTSPGIWRWVASENRLENVVSLQTSGPYGLILGMQLIPGTRRMHWTERERLISSDPFSLVYKFWSSDLEGGDIRSEFGVVDGVIDALGEKIYYYDDQIPGFARVGIDGTEAQDLGFGGAPSTGRLPGVHPDGEWLYFTAIELVPTPGAIEPLISIFRGHVETGVVEELPGETQYAQMGGSLPPEFAFEFDPANGLIHAAGPDVFSYESALLAFDLDTGALLGGLEFGEGEGGPGLFAFDPDEQEYYYVRHTGDPDQPILRRISYADVLAPPTFPMIEAASETVLSFPFLEGSTTKYLRPSSLHYETTHTVLVPEPSVFALSVSSLAAVLFVATQRRRWSRESARSPLGRGFGMLLI